MRIFVVIIFSSIFLMNSLKNDFSGIYQLNLPEKSTRWGEITIYQNSDSTALFYIDLCRGAPSYNLGGMVNEMKFIEDSIAIVEENEFASENGKNCKFSIQFNNNGLSIKTIDNCDYCGFGFGVFADGEYKIVNSEKPKYFIWDNTRILFDTLSIRKWHER